MRFKKTFLITIAVVLSMTAFSFSVTANVSANDETAQISVNDSVESKTPLTPKGNLTTVDDVHQVSDENTVEDKQFITVQSKNGNTFYIIIDRSGDTENVYFLNAVDESDLLALMEDSQNETSAATCTCSEKCAVGSVNTECAVCSTDKDRCTGTVTPEPTPVPGETQQEQSQNTAMPLAALIIFALFGAGGAFYWFKIRNKKTSTKGGTDPNDLFEDDEDYETEDETDYEVEQSDEEDTETADEEADEANNTDNNSEESEVKE